MLPQGILGQHSPRLLSYCLERYRRFFIRFSHENDNSITIVWYGRRSGPVGMRNLNSKFQKIYIYFLLIISVNILLIDVWSTAIQGLFFTSNLIINKGSRSWYRFGCIHRDFFSFNIILKYAYYHSMKHFIEYYIIKY